MRAVSTFTTNHASGISRYNMGPATSHAPQDFYDWCDQFDAEIFWLTSHAPIALCMMACLTNNPDLGRFGPAINKQNLLPPKNQIPSYIQQWRMWILRRNGMSRNVADSKLLTLGQTCSVGELQHLAKNDFREKGWRDDDDWLWRYDAKIKSTFGFELYVWCSPQYFAVENVGVCLWLFFWCGISAKKAKSEMKIHRCFFISSLHIPVYCHPYTKRNKTKRSVRGRLFFCIPPEFSFWREIWGPLGQKKFSTFDFCFLGPHSDRMVILTSIPSEFQHMRLMSQKRSSERQKEPHSDRILSVALLLQNLNSDGISLTFWGVGGYEVFFWYVFSIPQCHVETMETALTGRQAQKAGGKLAKGSSEPCFSLNRRSCYMVGLYEKNSHWCVHRGKGYQWFHRQRSQVPAMDYCRGKIQRGCWLSQTCGQETYSIPAGLHA